MTGPFPEDSAERKTYPVYSGVLQYFPAALAKVARHSYDGNAKHNPGQPLHHARGKSDDHLDAASRHLIEGDLTGAAWRILAALQLECEAEGAPMAPGARVFEPANTAKWTTVEMTALDGPHATGGGESSQAAVNALVERGESDDPQVGSLKAGEAGQCES